MFIPVILGTGREGRQSEKVAKAVHKEVLTFGMESDLVDVRDHAKNTTVPSWEESEKTAAWKVLAAKADGYIIVAPEYNHSFPGELKIMLDGAYEEYEGKPVMAVTVSGGRLGGARVGENLLHYLVALGMYPPKQPVFVSGVKDSFNDDGTTADEKFVEKVKEGIILLKKRAEALKTVR